MNPTAAAATDLTAIRARLQRSAGPAASRRAIGLESINVGADALDALPGEVRDALHADSDGDIVVITDATPMRRGDRDPKADALAALRSAFGRDRVRHAVIGRAGAGLHADVAALAEADAAVVGAAVVVSIGSGTITPTSPRTRRSAPACHRSWSRRRCRSMPSRTTWPCCCATASSGRCRRPGRHALVIDLRLIADAPAAMNRAGFGELTAMFTAPADWYLASAVAGDGTFDPG